MLWQCAQHQECYDQYDRKIEKRGQTASMQIHRSPFPFMLPKIANPGAHRLRPEISARPLPGARPEGVQITQDPGPNRAWRAFSMLDSGRAGGANGPYGAAAWQVGGVLAGSRRASPLPLRRQAPLLGGSSGKDPPR